jgi:hypothetical protein
MLIDLSIAIAVKHLEDPREASNTKRPSFSDPLFHLIDEILCGILCLCNRLCKSRIEGSKDGPGV